MDRSVSGRYLRSGVGDRDAVDDDFVSGSKARRDDPQATAKIAYLDDQRANRNEDTRSSSVLG